MSENISDVFKNKGFRLGFHSIYAMIFAMSGIIIGVTIWSLIDDYLETNHLLGVLDPITIFVLAVVIAISVVHQFYIYNGLHTLNNSPDVEGKKWIGSRIEKTIRFLMMISILLAFSKAAPVFELSSMFGYEISIPKAIDGVLFIDKFDNELDAYVLDEKTRKVQVYLFSISITFFLLVVWSVASLIHDYILVASPDKFFSWKNEVLLWLISDFLALIIWLSLLGIVYSSEIGIFFGIVLLSAFSYTLACGTRMYQHFKKV